MQKRRRKGRKPDGVHRDARITVRVKPDLRVRIDEAAATAGTSRSQLVETLLEQSLASTPALVFGIGWVGDIRFGHLLGCRWL